MGQICNYCNGDGRPCPRCGISYNAHDFPDGVATISTWASDEPVRVDRFSRSFDRAKVSCTCYRPLGGGRWPVDMACPQHRDTWELPENPELYDPFGDDPKSFPEPDKSWLVVEQQIVRTGPDRNPLADMWSGLRDCPSIVSLALLCSVIGAVSNDVASVITGVAVLFAIALLGLLRGRLK